MRPVLNASSESGGTGVNDDVFKKLKINRRMVYVAYMYAKFTSYAIINRKWRFFKDNVYSFNNNEYVYVYVSSESGQE